MYVVFEWVHSFPELISAVPVFKRPLAWQSSYIAAEVVQVPVLVDGDRHIIDSWEILKYLEATYTDKPRLFGPSGKFVIYPVDTAGWF